MADKKKKSVKVRDLKPSKDAKGGTGVKPNASGLSGSLSTSRLSGSPSSK